MIASFRQKPGLWFLSLLLLLGLACQAATAVPSLSSTDVDTDAVVAEAIATIEAQTQPNGSSTGETSPINTIQVSEIITADLEDQLVEIYERINPAVVHIFVYDEDGFLLSTGSGFVIDQNGNMVTNNHVIAGGAELEIVFPDGQRRRATIQGTDVDSDLAAIQVDNLPDNVQPVPLGDSNELKVGQFVLAIGNPFGAAGSMTVGIISALGRTIESQRVVDGGNFSIPKVIQTDAAINPGNSGGPLLNLSGEVVGVNSNILSRTGENSGVGFSIPVNAVRNIIPALIENGEYVYPYIGISMWPEPFTLNQLEILELPPNGVYITGVTEGTPADEAGLIGNNLSTNFTDDGDYITAINGESVRNSDELLSYLVFETEVGDTVELTILRDGEEVTLPLTLGERP